MEDSLENFIKLTRNTKGHKMETQFTETSQQAIVTTQKKAQCEYKASKIVEFLIEGKLRPEVFVRCLKHLNQAYYQDVVEERAITKVCGYSLCNNQIPDMPSKQFFIDTKCNKVYDITDRKNYCSNFCYRASVHIKQQIDDSPLWLRKVEESPNFNLLPNTERGTPGEEINQGIAKPVSEPSFTSISSFAEVSLEDLSNDEIKSKKCYKTDKKQQLQTLNEDDELSLSIELTSHTEEASHKAGTFNMSESSKPLKNSTNKTPRRSKTKNDYSTAFDNIKKYVQEWMTLETYIFLYGEDCIKEHIDETHLQEHFNSLKHADSSITQQRKYLEICTKLHFSQLIDDSFDKSILGIKIKPVPDYKQLKENNKNLEIKVRSFYSGESYEVDNVKNTNEKSIELNPQKVDSYDIPAVLPLVDVNSQNALRKKIYLNSISKAMLVLIKHLQIPAHHVLEELSLLVKTFHLQAHNITFEPFLWSVIALVLIKMLGIRDDNLKAQLDSNHSKMFISAMLNQMPNSVIFFEELFNGIENINLFLQKYLGDTN